MSCSSSGAGAALIVFLPLTRFGFSSEASTSLSVGAGAALVVLLPFARLVFSSETSLSASVGTCVCLVRPLRAGGLTSGGGGGSVGETVFSRPLLGYRGCRGRLSFPNRFTINILRVRGKSLLLSLLRFCRTRLLGYSSKLHVCRIYSCSETDKERAGGCGCPTLVLLSVKVDEQCPISRNERETNNGSSPNSHPAKNGSTIKASRGIIFRVCHGGEAKARFCHLKRIRLKNQTFESPVTLLTDLELAPWPLTMS